MNMASKFANAILLFSAMLIAVQATLLCETPLAGDFDGDGKCDPTIHTRSMGTWQVRLSSMAYNTVSTHLGAAAFTPLPGDFDGDRKSDPTVYQDNTGLWIIKLSGLGYAPMCATLGGSGYVPIAGDFDGDGKYDPAVYQETTGRWLVNLSTIGYATVSTTLGGTGYTTVSGDYDGDGKTDPAVYGNGTWSILLSSQGYVTATMALGGTNWTPVCGDFDGDGKTDPAVYDNANGIWMVNLSSLEYVTFATRLGDAGTTPLTGDYDGDGKADPSVYCESTRTMTTRLSGNNYEPVSVSIGTAPPARVLILYDSLGQYGWWGNLFQQMLANLISHFNIPYTTQPVERYSTGNLNGFTATFYIGCIYDNPLNSAFRQDVLSSTNTVCWLGLNLSQIAWSSSSNNPAFTEKFGFQFDGNESGFTEVRYKGKTLPFTDPDSILGIITIINSNRASAQVTAYSGQTSNSCPYITHASNLWYVADNPLGFETMADRTLAFADILHDILGIQHAESHRAVIRIEDVNPMTTVSHLDAIALYLQGQNIPYTVSVIPEYRDPLGVDNGGIPRTVTMDDRTDLVDALNYMASHGGQIIQHGYTHQYDSVPNPHGSTASDYEFYRCIAENGTNVMVGPVLEDNGAWAGQRVLTGHSILSSHELTPIAWLTPHYYASEIDYGVFPALFPLALDRGVYFASDTDGATHGLEHLPAFMIPRDVYGQRRVPETIGYISPSEGILPATLIDRADKNLVVRDGWASCYYHWFLGTNYLPELVTGLTNLGFRFTTIDPAME